jgi:hypothetical protein
MNSFTLLPVGCDKFVISLQPPEFLGIKPTGFIRKLDIGGEGKGPIILPRYFSSNNFSDNIDLICRAEVKLSDKTGILGPQ